MYRNQQTAIVPGSIGAIAQQSGKSLAESFVNADVVVIVDTSGSMDAHDSRDGRTRYDIACVELAGLQNNLPGKIAVISFSHDVTFCPSGVPTYFGGDTDLAGALKYAKLADVTGMRFILISDGEPNDENEALRAAKTYKNKIDVIYVGSETSPTGRAFLEKLARASGGMAITADRAVELQASVQKLIADGSGKY